MSIVQNFQTGDSDDDKVKSLVFLSRTAENSERFEDMCAFMSDLVNLKNGNLNTDERNLLSVAYKNVIGQRRAAWRMMDVEDYKDNEHIKKYKGVIEKELENLTNEVLGLLENKLVPNAADKEAQAFYHKMTGDYYRYLAEFITTKDYGDKASKHYSDAVEVAKEHLKPTHPIYLGLMLNYSVCCYEILKDKDKACSLAKKAFDDAIAKLDDLDESSYKDSTLIMQLLRDNLTLWTSAEDEDED